MIAGDNGQTAGLTGQTVFGIVGSVRLLSGELLKVCQWLMFV